MSVPQQMLAPCPNFARVQPVLFCFDDCLLEDEGATKAHIIAMWAAVECCMTPVGSHQDRTKQAVQGSQGQVYMEDCMQNYTTAYLDCLESRL